MMLKGNRLFLFNLSAIIFSIKYCQINFIGTL